MQWKALPLTVLATALAVAILAWPTSTAAHWDKTRWGMSIQQLQAVYPSARKLRDDLYRIEGPFVIHGYTFEAVAANFDSNRLFEVYGVVQPDDVMSLQATLARNLGQGRTAFDRTASRFVSGFDDVSGGNRVFLYGPSSAAGSKGKLSFLTPNVDLPEDERARRRQLCAADALSNEECAGI